MIGLFGMWGRHDYNCELHRFDPEESLSSEPPKIVIRRPFAAKEFTLTISQAKALMDALTTLIGE